MHSNILHQRLAKKRREATLLDSPLHVKVSLLTWAARRLRLQLFLQIVEETPVGTLRNNLLRTRLDHANLM